MNDQSDLFTAAQQEAKTLLRAPDKRSGNRDLTPHPEKRATSHRSRTAKPKAQPVPQPEPIPKRLYVSNGLAFGLIDGGQEPSPFTISWGRLKPIQRVDASKEARTK